MMSEKQVIVTLEDGLGRVQTSIATSLSAPQLMDKIMEIDEQLKAERRNDAKEFSALFKQNLRLKRENDKLKKEIKNDWVCGCCKHFHLGIKDRCDKGHNWVLKDESCQDFER